MARPWSRVLLALSLLGTPGRAAPGADALGDPLPPGALARLGTVRLRHGHPVTGVAFAPDGSALASCGHDHAVRLWRLPGGKELRTFTQEAERDNPYALSRWLACVAFAPDGKTVAAAEGFAGWDANTVRVWETATGRENAHFAAHKGGSFLLAFSADGKTLATAGNDSTVQLWDPATGKELAPPVPIRGGVRAIGFAAADKALRVAGADGIVHLVDTATGKPRGERARFPAGAAAAALSPDGKWLASAGAAGAIRLTDLATGQRARDLAGHRGAVRRLAFAAEGTVLASAGADKVLRLWDVASGREVHHLRADYNVAPALAFAADGKTLAAAGDDATVRLWDVATGKEVVPAAGPQGPARLVRFTPDGKTVITSSWDGWYRRWDPAAGKELARFEAGAGDLSPDGNLLAVGRDDGTVALTVLSSKDPPVVLSGHSGPIKLVRFTPDGRQLLSGGADRTLRLWDVARAKELRRLPPVNGWPSHAAFTPDGRTVAVATAAAGGRAAWDNAPSIYDVTAGRQTRRLAAQPAAVGALAYAPDGQTLAVGCQDGVVRLVDATGRELRQLTGHPGYVASVSFSPDGRTLAVGCWRSVYLWEVATGKERARLTGHAGDVFTLAYAPDGRTLGSGGVDTTALVWDATGLDPADRQAVRPPDAKRLQQLWADLGGEDAARTFRAVGALSAAPAESVPFIKGRVRPVAGADEATRKEIARLIGDLDSDDFETREKASAGLARHGKSAEPALRRALEGDPSAEVRDRVTGLLEKLGKPGPPAELMGALRAVEVLEHVGNADARRVLQALAAGLPEARLTQEARAAVDRLARRPAP